MTKALELLQGAYDLHVHTGPDVSERKLDDLEMAERLKAIGMKGFVIKSHYFSSAERARLVNKLHPEVKAMGGLTLNNTVGGINPEAVEISAKLGVKVIWMPTFDAENEARYMEEQSNYEEPPPWAQVQKDINRADKKHLTILDADENLTPGTLEIIEISKSNGMILATGHLSKNEIFKLVKECRDRNHKKIVVTHPTFSSVALSKEEQRELTELGAIMEQCFGVITPDYGIDWGGLYKTIRFVGPENCILSSDLGQITNPYPDEGLQTFVQNLLNNGFTEDEIRKMTENTVELVEG